MTCAYLAAVDVPQVKRIARELHTIGPLDKRRAVSLYSLSTAALFSSISGEQLTGNLPGKIVRDSGGHFVCMGCGYGLGRACR